MEAGEKGLFPSTLRFGHPEGVSEALQDIAYGADWAMKWRTVHAG
jgi:hypothetical protein